MYEIYYLNQSNFNKISVFFPSLTNLLLEEFNNITNKECIDIFSHLNKIIFLSNSH